MSKMHDYEIRKQLFNAFNNQPLKLKKHKKKIKKVKKTKSNEATPVNHLYNFGADNDNETDVIDLNIDIRPKIPNKRALILSKSNNDIVQPVTRQYRYFPKTEQSEKNSSITTMLYRRKKESVGPSLANKKSSINMTTTSSQKSSKKKFAEAQLWEEFNNVKTESGKIKRHLLNVLNQQKSKSLKPREYGLVGNLWMKQL